MKEVVIRSKAIPAKMRSDNYPTGSTVTHGSSGNQTVVVAPGAEGNTGGVDILKTYDTQPETNDNVMSALRTKSEIESRIITSNDTTQATDSNTYSAKRAIIEFLSKTSPERTEYLLKLLGGALIQQGLTVDRLQSPNFVGGLTGVGFNIDALGEAWLKSLHLTGFLEAPELRFNRTEVTIGDQWSSPGGGIIASVDALNKIVTLKLEEGETGAVAVDDICRGIYHSMTASENATSDMDDSKGNRKMAGFATSYFRITEVLDGGKRFRYALRGVSPTWSQSIEPMAMMHFVAQGNFTNKERQSSRYATRSYLRFLRDVSDWEFSAHNIAMQFGDLSNLKAFGIDMTGYSAYLANIYMTGKIDQSAHLPDRMEFDSSNGSFLSVGEQTVITPYLYNAWDDVTSKYGSFLWTRDSGQAQEDAAWNLAHSESSRTLTVLFTDLHIGRTVFSCTASKQGATLTGNVII